MKFTITGDQLWSCVYWVWRTANYSRCWYVKDSHGPQESHCQVQEDTNSYMLYIYAHTRKHTLLLCQSCVWMDVHFLVASSLRSHFLDYFKKVSNALEYHGHSTYFLPELLNLGTEMWLLPLVNPFLGDSLLVLACFLGIETLVFSSLSASRTQAFFPLYFEASGQCLILQCQDQSCGRAQPQMPLGSEEGRLGPCESHSDSLGLSLSLVQTDALSSNIPANSKILKFYRKCDNGRLRGRERKY